MIALRIIIASLFVYLPAQASDFDLALIINQLQNGRADSEFGAALARVAGKIEFGPGKPAHARTIASRSKEDVTYKNHLVAVLGFRGFDSTTVKDLKYSKAAERKFLGSFQIRDEEIKWQCQAETTVDDKNLGGYNDFFTSLNCRALDRPTRWGVPYDSVNYVIRGLATDRDSGFHFWLIEGLEVEEVWKVKSKVGDSRRFKIDFK